MRNLTRLALTAAAAAALAACASHKPPPPVAPTAPPPPADTGAPPPPPPVAARPTGPLPGTEQDFVVNVGDRVYFDFDQYTLRDEGRRVLDAQAAWLQRYPSVTVRIEGNADERGTREYNFALGARRAEAVRTYLIDHGVAAGRITTISYGKERPIAEGETEEAFAKNRNAHTAITGGVR